MSKHNRMRALLTIWTAIILMPMAPGFAASARQLDFEPTLDERAPADGGVVTVAAMPALVGSENARLTSDIVEASKNGAPADALQLASLALESRARISGQADSPLVATAALGLDRVGGIRSARADAEAPLDSTLRAALGEPSAVTLDPLTPVAARAPLSLGDAIRFLAAREDVQLSQASSHEIDQLATLPTDISIPLRDMIVAFIAIQTQSEAIGLTAPVLATNSAEWSLDLGLAKDGTILQPAPLVDTDGSAWQASPALNAARIDLVEAAAQLLNALEARTPLGQTAVLRIDEIIALDLDLTDTTYTQDYRLVIDAGGNDVYHNNAGGSGNGGVGSQEDTYGAAALIDLQGNDVYGETDEELRRSGGANGGGFLGTGFLFDAAGDDAYYAGYGGVNGGGFQGSGFLIDTAGNDVYISKGGAYQGGNGANGGASLGSGFLLDGDGSDSYETMMFGGNGGLWSTGMAALLDLGVGSDSYNACANGVNGGTQGDNALAILYDEGGDDSYVAGCAEYGNSGYVNGGGDGGVGILVDLSGTDFYYASRIGNGGGGNGIGILIDATGSDRYRGGLIVNGAARYQAGLGILVDTDGDDYYRANGDGNNYGSGNGAGVWAGQGVLIDLAGRDRYIAGMSGGNGGAYVEYLRTGVAGVGRFDHYYPTTGFLADLGLDGDTYSTGDYGGNGGAVGTAVGYLFDSAGNDIYNGASYGSNGGGAWGGQGNLLDAGGPDMYSAGTGGVNGGASDNLPFLLCSRDLGCLLADAVNATGLLTDLEGWDIYEDQDGGTGVDRTVIEKAPRSHQLDLPVNPADLRVPPTPPDAPNNLVVEGGSAANSLKLAWEVPAQNGGQAVTAYRIYRGLNAEELEWISDVTGPRTYEDAGLAPDTAYYYEVTAVSSLGEGAPALGVGTPGFCSVAVDSAGYTCSEAPYEWLDGSAGTLLPLGVEQTSEPLPLPFSVNWYESTQTEVIVGSNGLLCFVADGCGVGLSFYNEGFPNPSGVNGVIACYGGYFGHDGVVAGSIRYSVVGEAPSRTFLVQWDEIPHYDDYSGGTNTFQTQLREDGSVRCMLQHVIADPNSGRPVGVGIESPSGEQGVRYAWVAGGFAIENLGIAFNPPN